MADRYPLDWPAGWSRTPSHKRRDSRFRSTVGASRDLAFAELERLGARGVVMSTDVPVRNDGLFYASARNPDDPGVALYFQWKGRPHVIACDSYRRLWENLRAVGKTIEALRTIERHGASQLLERAVSGFSALPPGSDDLEETEPAAPWWEVLELPASIGDQRVASIAGDRTSSMRTLLLDLARAQHKRLAREHHPDRGGDTSVAQQINEAWDDAKGALDG